MYKDEGMVSVNSPEAGAPHKKEHSHGGHADGAHKMIMHQLTNAHQNACELLEHLSKCSTPHLEEEWVKKKIILATDYLDSVRDYIMSSHGKHGRDEPDPVTGGFMVMVEKRAPE